MLFPVLPELKDIHLDLTPVCAEYLFLAMEAVRLVPVPVPRLLIWKRFFSLA
jgi:hypothetical protein